MWNNNNRNSTKWLVYFILLSRYVTSQQHGGSAAENPENEIVVNSARVAKTRGSTGNNNQQSYNSVQVLSEHDEDEEDRKNETDDNDDIADDDVHVEELEDQYEASRSMPPVDPEKINTDNDTDCETWLERASEFINGDYDAFSRLCGESSDRNSSGYGEEVAPDLAVGNFFRFSIFMTLPPNWQSTGNALDDALTAALDDAFPQYRIMTDHVEYSWGRPSDEIQADIMSYKVKPSLVRIDENRWWWQYSFKYFCYIPGTIDPLDEATGKQAFEDIMGWIEVTESKLKSISDFAHQMEGVTYDMQMDPPRPCDDCVYMTPCYGLECDLSPTYAPPLSPESEAAPLTPTIFPSPSPTSEPSRLGAIKPPMSATAGEIVLDVTAWNWRRYSGLALLLTTVMGTFCLSQTARLRNAARSRKEDWGNLATEEGVDQILRTGWKVKGSLMEIYDRKNVGYRDGDSMLVGGYEERVPVGSEIAVSRTQSETVVGTVQS